MTMNRYTLLGRSGLRVSPIALGTMTFGTEWGWGVEEKSAQRLFDLYVDAGGNFIDTADLYTEGTSEKWLGKFVAARGLRERLVIATKYGYNAETGNPTARSSGSARTTSTCITSTRGIASRRWTKSCAQWTTPCAPARSAMSACRIRPPGSPDARRRSPTGAASNRSRPCSSNTR
jgi:hypothetical protein